MNVMMKEYKPTTENYNMYYYLVLRLNDETFKTLNKGRILKLSGISASVNIINSFFDIRNLLLVMKKEDVDALNNVTPVDYDDVEFLSKNNLKVLRRLYDKCDDTDVGSLLYQGIRKTSYLSLKKNHRSYYTMTNHRLVYLYKKMSIGMWKKFNDFDRHHSHKLNKIKTFKTFNDLVNKSFKILKQHYSKDEISDILEFIILSFANCFKREEEVLVNNKSFKIPENSVLFIKHENPHSCKHIESLELISKYKEPLLEKYNIKELPYISGRIISNSHKPTFAYIRYLSKMFGQ